MAVNPKSLKNLTNSGSKPRYSEKKQRRHLSVTNTAWVQAKSTIEQDFNISVSEAVELIGRGKLKLVKVD